MATKPAIQQWTCAEYARLPDDGNRYEGIAGELHMSPAPRPRTHRALVPLIAPIEAFSQEQGSGTLYPGSEPARWCGSRFPARRR